MRRGPRGLSLAPALLLAGCLIADEGAVRDAASLTPGSPNPAATATATAVLSASPTIAMVSPLPTGVVPSTTQSAAATIRAPVARSPTTAPGPGPTGSTPTPAPTADPAPPGPGCADEPALRSTGSAPTYVLFDNLRSSRVETFWVDYTGQRKRYGTVGPGEVALQETYAGHAWVVADLSGTCIHVHVATLAPSRVTLRDIVAGAAPTASPPPSTVSGRSMSDRPDDLAGAQVHFIYAVPSDGADQQLDVNGRIATGISAIQTWLAGQTGGRTLRIDTFGGRPDITFFRASLGDATVAGSGAYVRDRIEDEIIDAGLVRSNKIYAVYWGGSSTLACGGAAWPPALPGIVGAIYLRGTPPGAPACATNPIGASETTPGYFEFSILHEIVHTLGFARTCAPNHTRSGHVSDDPRDLMYAGDQPWYPSLLDVGRNDYYGHGIAGCPDLAGSEYLTGQR